ncbi:Na+/H+ antiporter NhaC family protein [Halococcus salsus]|uniref:Na+/H+ antiporter NhaC family protein n=1 Tax=Halococcus salsus TaxID=2162894 RepID=UPI00135CEC7C|nr:Na+/H+ antiporter NhaC family protein [Halococcus salsus]
MSSDRTGGSEGSADEYGEGLGDASEGPRIEFYGGRWLSALPLAIFVVWAVVQSGLLQVSATSGLVVGMLVALIIGMFFVKGDWKDYANTIFEGMTQPVAATAIVAWLWAGMFADTLQAGQFVGGLVWAANALSVGAALFPAATFILAALLATGIGSGYGTAIAFTTLFFPAGVLLGANPILMFGAILSGAVFGDNLAPVSDTTIVSAVTQDADIGGVVASRFKYAIIAAVFAFAGYVVAGSTMGSPFDVGQNAQSLFVQNSDPLGLVHLVAIGVVIATAVAGRHIVEAISWGIIASVVFNLVFGLSSISDILVFQAPRTSGAAQSLSGLPVVELVDPGSSAVGGSLFTGATGFFPLIVLTLLIVAGAQILVRGGGFAAMQDWLLTRVATSVRRAETTMVLGTAAINSMITINTAAEIAIAPYIARIGERFNINGYRRANILDANTSALGYIFPWGGGVLAGYTAMLGLPDQYDWFTQAMLVNPAQVWPFVFHGWFLFFVFVVAALSGFGLEYVSDRESEEVARV